ncbi:MAG TPA: amidohydrolase [Aliicoccus persicus]|uniref:Amidohydrolase n=1 Tax=Aliicoccus persicus TaxID=930138 RepID=A0A921JBS4_9STAP|nr:amidohydrolase [Aliicoccus persicus]
MSVKEKLFQLLEDKEQRMIEIRRHLHENPELSFEEENTAQLIADFYQDKDVKVTTNVGNGYGIIVEIKGNGEGKTIGLRADFDALPIVEEADVEFKSKNEGVMHACGHDVHTAYLLTLGEALIELKDEWSGTIKLIHQHAEEVPPGGAKSIVESGILDDLDEVYGMHIFPMFDTGVIQIVSGNAMCGRSNFDLTIQGKGGHGAMPDTTRDALMAGSYFVTQVQTIVSRNMSPMDSAVVSVTAFDAPGGYNVIQDKVHLRGTARYLQEENKEAIRERMEAMCRGIEESFDVTCTLDYVYDYPVLYNHPEETAEVKRILEGSVGDYLTEVADAEPISGSEDFSYYLLKTPGTFINVGARPVGMEDPYPNHHPKFEINEDALLICAKGLGDVVLSRLEA